MTNGDVYLDDMGFLIDTAELDRVLAGEVLPKDAPLARFVEDLRETFPPSPVPVQVEMQHLTVMMAAVDEISRSETALAEVPRLPTRLDRLRSSVAARVSALTLAAGSGLTGAAYAGVLPDPVQRIVSETAAQVGMDLPHPADDAPGEYVRGSVNDPRDDITSPEKDHDGPSAGTSGGSEGSSGDPEERSSRSQRSGGAGGDDQSERDDTDPDEGPATSGSREGDSDEADGDDGASEDGDAEKTDGSDSDAEDRDAEDGEAQDGEAQDGEAQDGEARAGSNTDAEDGQADRAGVGDVSGDADLDTIDNEVPSDLDD